MIFTGVASPLRNKLKVIQNVCLRLILGARTTTPIRSMEVEANIAPLDARHDYLLAKLYCKLRHRKVDDETTRLFDAIQTVESNTDTSQSLTLAHVLLVLIIILRKEQHLPCLTLGCSLGLEKVALM